HSGPVWKIAWSHPRYGSLLASCSYDGSVKIFKFEDTSYSVFYTYEGHKASVNSVCWSPYEYGACLAAVSSDGSMSCIYQKNEWEWGTTQTMICQLGCNCISWAPFRPGTSENANILRVAIGGGDGYVHIMECGQSVENGWEFESKLRGHKDRVRDVAWSPQIGDSTDVIASCGRSKQVLVWTRKCGKTWKQSLNKSYSEAVWRVNWSVNGCVLVVSYGVDGIDMWKERLDGTWENGTNGSVEKD
ncbi:uncharacterized protein, partial [Blastocystis hominis]